MNQPEVLEYIIKRNDSKELTIGQLMIELKMGRTAVSRMVKKLKKFGFIKTEPQFLLAVCLKLCIVTKYL